MTRSDRTSCNLLMLPMRKTTQSMLSTTYHTTLHVVREDKDTTKIRIVFDASAKSEGPSLNQCLHTEPNCLLYPLKVKPQLDSITSLPTPDTNHSTAKSNKEDKGEPTREPRPKRTLNEWLQESGLDLILKVRMSA